MKLKWQGIYHFTLDYEANIHLITLGPFRLLEKVWSAKSVDLCPISSPLPLSVSRPTAYQMFTAHYKGFRMVCFLADWSNGQFSERSNFANFTNSYFHFGE